MINFELDEANSTLVLVLYYSQSASGSDPAFDKSDFVELTKLVDAHIEATGGLDGLLISAPNFPGSFGALVPHFRFVRDHQRYVKKIALVTDSPCGDVGEHLVSHFVSAQIRHFPAGRIERARQWIAAARELAEAEVVQCIVDAAVPPAVVGRLAAEQRFREREVLESAGILVGP